MSGFDKDAWILRAIAARYIVVKEDGSIWRFDHQTVAKREYHRQKFSTHKKSGRVYFQMTFEGITKSVLVNRVVGLALLPNPLNLPEVNHCDGVKANNHPDNLEWASRADQERHAFRTGLKSTRGSSNSNAKLTPGAVERIRAAEPSLLPAIAEELGVSLKTVKDAFHRKTWVHL